MRRRSAQLRQPTALRISRIIGDTGSNCRLWRVLGHHARRQIEPKDVSSLDHVDQPLEGPAGHNRINRLPLEQDVDAFAKQGAQTRGRCLAALLRSPGQGQA